MANKSSKKSAKIPKPTRKHEVGTLAKQEDEFNGLAEFFPMKPEYIIALQEYQKDLDLDRAMKAAGISYAVKKKLLDPTEERGLAFLKEVKEIQDQYYKAIRLNASSSAVKHLELMAKIEADYDRADITNQNKGSFASTLAKMSDTSLKATGQFTQENKGGGTKVEINIDLSSNAQQDPPIDIKAEVVDE